MQTVSFAGDSYNIPTVRGDRPWSGLSDFVIAAASKAINTAGGNFTLLADINFGATFGLVSTYYKSRTANVASAGQLRLANTDTIKFRNGLNDADLSVAIATNRLTFEGSRLLIAAAAEIVNADISASAAIVFSKMAALTASRALQSSAGGVLEVSAVTSTELGYVSGVTSAIQTQINTKAADSAVVHNTGVESIAGAKTFTDPITQNDTSNQIVLGVTNTTTISATAPAASRVVTIPDPGGAASFVMTEGTQTVNGAKTLSGLLTVTAANVDTIKIHDSANTQDVFTLLSTSAGASDFILSSNRDPQTGTFTQTGQAGGSVLVHSSTGSGYVDIYASNTNNTGFTAVGHFETTGVDILGTTTNDSAAAGFVGQYLESVVGTVANAGSGTWGDITSLSITAGDWDVTIVVEQEANGATVTQSAIGIGTASGTGTTGLVDGSSKIEMPTPLNGVRRAGACIGNYRVSLAATTTYYLKMLSTFSVATPRTTGARLSARRTR